MSLRRAGQAGRAAAITVALLALACRRGDPPAPPPVPVVVARAELGAVPDRREYVGNVRAVSEIDVRARVRGYLIERAFTEGGAVAAGDLLFRIDPKPFEVKLADARATLARARAALALAETEFRRAGELRQQNVVSASQFDARREARDAAAAQVQGGAAAVESAELDLSYCTIHAPAAGRIGLALVDVGNLVGESGQDTVLARIVQVDPIHVYFAPTELERLGVIRGAHEGRMPQQREGNVPIELRLGDGTPYPHRGVVDYVDPTIEATRGTIAVRAVVPNPEGELKPGEFVRVIAVFPELLNAVLVPERSVLEEQGGSYVLVVDDASKVAYRHVTPGPSHQGRRQIAEGLKEGERVIVDGVQKARPGDVVQAREDGASP